MAAPPVGWVTVSTTDPPMTVTARLSDERPNVESGFGGWEEVARPRKTPITTFKSTPGLRLTLPILLDKWQEGVSIEKTISDLQQMGRPIAKDGEPPHIKISAAGGAVPYQGRTWVLSDLGFGDALMNDKGDRVRQQMTLSLLEFIADVYVSSKAFAQREKAQATQGGKGSSKKRVDVGKSPSKPPAKPKVGTLVTGRWSDYPFGSGEHLTRIAARELGDAERWPEIAHMNGLRDPRAVPFGVVIRLP